MKEEHICTVSLFPGVMFLQEKLCKLCMSLLLHGLTLLTFGEAPGKSVQVTSRLITSGFNLNTRLIQKKKKRQNCNKSNEM